AGPAFVTVMVYVVVRPAVTWLTPLVVVMLTSAIGAARDTAARPTLLPGRGSVLPVAAVAVFTIGSGPAYADGTANVMLSVWLPPAAIVHPVAAAHGPASPVTGVRPVGVGSVTTTFCASDGPSLVTVMVYVRLSPRCTVAGPTFVTRTSACGVIVALAAAVLFAVLTSAAV